MTGFGVVMGLWVAPNASWNQILVTMIIVLLAILSYGEMARRR